jgi:hypothetical protein
MTTLKPKWKADIEGIAQEEMKQKLHNQTNNFNFK